MSNSVKKTRRQLATSIVIVVLITAVIVGLILILGSGRETRTVTNEDEELLANCYKNSLKLAIESHLKTIAFPCISTGVFSFPSDREQFIA